MTDLTQFKYVDRLSLRATGEPVTALHMDSAKRALVRLEPMEPWHRPRFQTIHVDRIAIKQ